METNLFDLTDERKPVLKKVVLQNYRNIAYKEYLFNDRGAVFEGKNGIGKTNIIEAMYRNLSGKLFNSTDNKGETQEVKPIGSGRDTETKVRLEFDKDNFTFELLTSEKYDKMGEFKGYDNTYYVNNAVATKTQATTLLFDYLGLEDVNTKFKKDTELSKVDLIALMYDLGYLMRIDYKHIRAVIIDMVGDVRLEELINKNIIKYDKLKDELIKYGGDLEAVKNAHRLEKFGKGKEFGLEDNIEAKKKTKTTLEELANKGYDKEAVSKAKAEIERIDTQIVSYKTQLSSNNQNLTSKIDLDIAEAKNELLVAENAIREAHDLELKKYDNSTLDEEIATLKSRIQELIIKEQQIDVLGAKRELVFTEKKLEQKRFELEKNADNLSKLRNKHVNTKNGTSEEKYTCPCCDKSFFLHETKEFQANKQIELDKINNQGRSLKNLEAELEDAIETLNLEKENLEKIEKERLKEKEQLTSNRIELEKQLQALNDKKFNEASKRPTIDFEVEPLISIKEHLKTLETKRNEVLSNNQEFVNGLTQEIATLEYEKVINNEVIKSEIIHNQYLIDIKSVDVEIAKYEKRLVEVNNILDLIKDIEQEKYVLLENKVSNVFGDNFKVEMYRTNADGSYDTQVCVVRFKDVHGNYVRMQNINSGLYPIRAIEFTNKIRNHYKVENSFIFVDELAKLDTEHTQKLAESGLQIIATRPSDSNVIDKVDL